MGWEVKDDLTEEELKRGLRGVTLDGLASKATLSLTSGAFLVAFGLLLGADNQEIGVLAAIPFLTQWMQLPTVYLIEKMRIRRPISAYAALVGRSCFLAAAIIPFVVRTEWQVTAIIGVLALRGVFAAVSQCAWSSWMRDLVPFSQRGTFYAKRMSLAALLGMALSLLAGFYLDWFKGGYPQHEVLSYSLLFALAFVIGIANVVVIARIPEPRMKPNGSRMFELLLRPFRDANFRNLMKFLVPWNFAINLATPFFAVYMLRSMKMDMTSVMALSVLSQLANVAMLRIWGRFMDRFSNKSVLNVCAPLFIVSIFLWIFVLHDGRHMLTVPLLIILHVSMGVAMAGTVLGTSNLAIGLSPKEAASSYLASSNLANSLAAGIAPVIGGTFADFFAERKLTLILKWTTPLTEKSFQTFKLHH
ncbi:MFS transporter, partial [Thermodesulfobacteriota bacterium]